MELCFLLAITVVATTLLGCFGCMGGRIRGTPGDIDPLNKVPLKRANSRA